jgi:hypothetical protein
MIWKPRSSSGFLTLAGRGSRSVPQSRVFSRRETFGLPCKVYSLLVGSAELEHVDNVGIVERHLQVMVNQLLLEER